MELFSACAGAFCIFGCVWLRLCWEMRKFRKETDNLLKKFDSP